MLFSKALPGKLIIDPFTGTGSLLVTCSHFGAITMGGDVDPRVLRGKGNYLKTVLSSIISNLKYHKEEKM